MIIDRMPCGLNLFVRMLLTCLTVFHLNAESIVVTISDPGYNNEIRALQDLYISCQGDYWNWNASVGTHWNFTSVYDPIENVERNIPCQDQWQGISCSCSPSSIKDQFNRLNTNYYYYFNEDDDDASHSFSYNCTIRKLSLRSMNLTGTLPETLSLLSNATHVNLGNNRIHGTIPATVIDLQALQVLSMPFNYLIGSLPMNLSRLQQLKIFNVQNNILNGTIPRDIICGSIQELTHLYLQSNLFSGTISACIQNTNISVLNISSNYYIHGTLPSDFGNVSYLDISSTGFHGTIPDPFQSPWRFKYLSMHQTNLNHTIPSSLSLLSNLEYLDISDNFNLIVSTIPTYIFSFLKLEYLNLNDVGLNGFNGTIPLEIGNLTRLETLYLASNRLTGSFPSTFYQLTALKHLSIYAADFTGSIPSSISRLQSLEFVLLTLLQIGGELPVEITSLTNLKSLSIAGENIYGPIPNDWSSMTNIVDLQLFGNSLTGTLPNSMGQMTLLESFTVGGSLSGTIPSSFFQLINLKAFYGTSLSGSLPTYVYSSWKQLTSLSMISNTITGSINSGIGLLTNLQALVFESTSSGSGLTGTIPASLSNLIHLTELVLISTSLSGSLPSNLDQLTRLSYFDVDAGRLSGTIPTELAALTSIITFNLVGPNLSGTIPSQLALMVNNIDLIINGGKLSGTIPSEIFAMTSLQRNLQLLGGYLTGPVVLAPSGKILSMYIQNIAISCLSCDGRDVLSKAIQQLAINSSNLNALLLSGLQLTGPLLSFLSPSLSNLQQLTLANNSFTGRLEESFFTCFPNLKILDLSNNLLEGTLPIFLNTSFNLIEFSVDNNFFSGSLDESIGILSNLIFLVLANNGFTGGLPRGIANCYLLQYLQLSNNHFTGSLDFLYNATSPQLQMQAFDVSNNIFTGTLPPQLFSLPIQSFSASVNCFHGSIPSTICNMTSLTYLAMDGLNTADTVTCRKKFFFNIFNTSAYSPVYTITGSIPSCLYSMPTLQVLHASNNGISSKLEITDKARGIGQSLRNLAISHNFLIGSIPEEIQTHPSWSYLDLSFNFLSGTLSNNITVNQTTTELAANDNRLSGLIPESLLHGFKHINILSGNLFACDETRRSETLPAADPSFQSYGCASDEFDYSSFVWIGFLLVIIAILFYFRWSYRTTVYRQINSLWGGVYSEGSSRSLEEFGQNLNRFRTTMVYIVCAIVCFYLPVYGALSIFAKSMSFRYAWTVSALFLGGQEAGIILTVLFFTIMLGISYIWIRRQYISQDSVLITTVHAPSVDNVNAMERLKHAVWLYGGLLLIIAMNLTVMAVVNVYFVIASTQYEANVNSITAISAGLSLFKGSWTWSFIPTLLDVHYSFSASYFSTQRSTTSRVNHMMLLLSIALTNIIIIPCLVVMVSTSTCFYYIFHDPKEVSLTINTQFCRGVAIGSQHSVVNICFYDNSIINSLPPFQYTYQCGSMVISQYAVVFVFQFLIGTFATPFLQLCTVYFYPRIHQYWFAAFIPRLLKPPGCCQPMGNRSDRFDEDEEEAEGQQQEQEQEQRTVSNPTHESSSFGISFVDHGHRGDNQIKLIDTQASVLVNSILDAAVAPTAVVQVTDNVLAAEGRIFKLDHFIVKLFTLVTICMTFGLVFPPMAVGGLIAIFAMSYSTQLLLANYLSKQISNQELILVQQECRDVNFFVWRASLFVFPLMFIFQSLFIFDIVGSAGPADASTAIAATLPILFFPLLLYILCFVYHAYYSRKSTLDLP